MAIAIGISLAGCVTSESEYVDAVRDHIKQGPIAACCTAPWELPAAAAARARCEADAITRCVFARDATVRAGRIVRFGHDDGAMVDVEARGDRTGGCKITTSLEITERPALERASRFGAEQAPGAGARQATGVRVDNPLLTW